MKDDTSKLTKLGDHGTKYQYQDPHSDMLEVFSNQYPNRDYYVEYEFFEFTSLCPKTGQPDFATIKIDYIPKKVCIETKSLKTYFLAYRNTGAFMESIVNKILDDCVRVCNPKLMRIEGTFNIRGGTAITVTAEYSAEKEAFNNLLKKEYGKEG